MQRVCCCCCLHYFHLFNFTWVWYLLTYLLLNLADFALVAIGPMAKVKTHPKVYLKTPEGENVPQEGDRKNEDSGNCSPVDHDEAPAELSDWKIWWWHSMMTSNVHSCARTLHSTEKRTLRNQLLTSVDKLTAGSVEYFVPLHLHRLCYRDFDSLGLH